MQEWGLTVTQYVRVYSSAQHTLCEVRETAGKKKVMAWLISNWVVEDETEQKRGHTYTLKHTDTHLGRGVRVDSWLIPLSTEVLKILLQLIQQPEFLKQIL